MPILSDIIQGQQGQPQPQMPGGIMEMLKNLTQPAPPPTPEEQQVRGKTKAIASLVDDFSGSLTNLSPEEKKPLVSAFMKNILNPPTQSLAEGKVKGTKEPTKTPTALPAEKTGGEEKQKSILWEMLKRVGVPGLAAILGSTGAMPMAGAAGLGTGYVKGMEEQEKLGLEKEKIEYSKAEKQDASDRADEAAARSIVHTMIPKGMWGSMEALDASQYQKLYDSALNLVKETKKAQSTQKDVVEKAVTGESPYNSYPDAFQENGFWKIIKNGKKYRIEE